MRVVWETRSCTRLPSKEKSPRPFSTNTVGPPWPVQRTWRRWPPRSTSLPGAEGLEFSAADSEGWRLRKAVDSTRAHAFIDFKLEGLRGGFTAYEYSELSERVRVMSPRARKL